MGCFTILKCKKKRVEEVIYRKPTNSKEYTAATLLEPGNLGPSLQSAPPGFINRIQPVRVTNGRDCALSTSSTLNTAKGITLSSTEFDEAVKDQYFSNPLPLPLPLTQVTGVLKSNGSLELCNGSSSMLSSGPLPLPPLPLGGGLRNFSFEEISASCRHFSVGRRVSEGISSTVYRASFGDDVMGSKKLESVVACLHPTPQGLREFVNEVNVVASLQHPHLCKILGFHAHEGSDKRMIVYERLFHGSLDELLYGKSDMPSIDFHARIKVALCAAQGLVFLHEEGPFQAMYHEFSSANIQVDKDFSAKLSGYGCVRRNMEIEISNTTAAVTNLSMGTLGAGLFTPKSNVWSFGILLLELLTGRKNYDSSFPKEHNIIKWSRPFLSDDFCLSLIMDPHLKGRFLLKAARTIADIALKCLQKDPSERPTMRAVAESLKNVQAMKYPCCFPLHKPSAVAKKLMFRSPSLDRTDTPSPGLKFSPSLPQRTKSVVSQARLLVTLPLPPQTCASTLSLEESRIHMLRNLSSPMLPRPGVEGF